MRGEGGDFLELHCGYGVGPGGGIGGVGDKGGGGGGYRGQWRCLAGLTASSPAMMLNSISIENLQF